MTAFKGSAGFSSLILRVYNIAARNFALNYYRTLCVTATYIISCKESGGKSLQSGQKCCIFAPAIEGNALGA